jgi:hypothetical protein
METSGQANDSQIAKVGREEYSLQAAYIAASACTFL